MNKPLMPAWKVALVTVLATLAILVVVAGILGSGSSDHSSESPFERGQKTGRQFGPFVVFAPIIAYVLQKSRIDRAKRG